MVCPMNRKQSVDSGSTNGASADTATRSLILNAPTLLDGIGELWRLCRAHERTRGQFGVTVVRRSRADRTLIAAYPDPGVPVGVTETETLWGRG